MRIILIAHVAAGIFGLLSGYVALYATKGAPAHRKSGLVFVCVMLALAVTGLMIAAADGVAPLINIPTALLTFYLVVTGFTTVQAPGSRPRWFDVSAMKMAFAIAAMCFVAAAASINKGGADAGAAYPLLLFTSLAFGAGIGDRRQLYSGPATGTPRLRRHLWRMCVALFIASMAFYLGRGRVPAAIASPALSAAGVLLPLAAVAYWMWKLRAKRPMREPVRISAEAV